MKWREDPSRVRPMLATLAEPPLQGSSLVFEPKYDGIRALVHVEPRPGRGRGARGDAPEVRIWSRLGNEKSSQFPSIVHDLQTWAAERRDPVFLDGEIVALDPEGKPSGFQRLQGRIHLKGSKDVAAIDKSQPVALIVFDVLRIGDEDVRGLPLTERRKHLEALFPEPIGELRLSEQVFGDGRGLHERALREGWEGLIVKEARAPYQSGKRSPAWRKLKVVKQQEFVVGGWTEPRQTRQYFGALLLGVQDPSSPGQLKYVGHTGTGFDSKELARVSKLLKARETKTSPFSERIKSNEPAHWVRPELVAEIRFTEWTDDQKLRHPVYLGLRDDKLASAVVAERPPKRGPDPIPSKQGDDDNGSVIQQLTNLEKNRKDGSVSLPDGSRLAVTNLWKIFWPQGKLTKGDLLRYYARVARFILPAVQDRPLVMKRFPNGIDKHAFYQQRKRLEQPPQGVRVETIPEGLDPIVDEDASRFIGGSLITLLYMAQIAAISQDPWFSRVQSPLFADYVAIDLDPGEGATFATVLEVARLVHDELHSLKVPSVPKTSGSRGLHIYIPLAPETTYESGMLFCQIVATVIATRHPKIATVERMVRARRKGTVYVDYLQNILGKTLATAYSARATDFAGVSTPLTWKEVLDGVDPREFTIVTAPDRFEKVGDLWAKLRTSKPADLEAVFRKYGSEE